MTDSATRVDDPAVSADVLTLVDGRRLAYRWFGADPAGDGLVVVHNHGGLSSSLDAAPAHEPAAAAGIRMLAPDRPGVGRSDRHPGHDVADWADDVDALLDALGVERCVTTGWSMGGQYALALVARLPDRVRRAAVIAGCPPLDDPTTFSQLNQVDHALVRLSRHHPGGAQRIFRLMHRMDERSAGKLAHRPARKEGKPGAMARAWGPVDASVLAGPYGALLARASAEGLADAEGQVDEYLAFGGPWGFDASLITAPVRIWQGDADRWVDQEWAAQLAALVTDGSVRPCPGEGHLLAVAHWPEILGWLPSNW